ncbi:MAG: HAMP domain-containing histidine kinase [Thermoleophilia bacterium]|nr:HAMP domain-containing histidine kinase [Thermoleophilia bacterium]
MTELVNPPGSGWLAPLFLLLILAAQSWRWTHRRTALNRALHEVRRPLQALALATAEPMRPGPAPTTGSVWQAIRALGDLDRQLNGLPGGSNSRELLACRLMVDACVRRWQSRARLGGSEVSLRWAGPDALVRGDGTAISGAVENLILNAIEHGGSTITVNGLAVGRWVKVEVIDSGRSRGRQNKGAAPQRLLTGAANRRRHGHGLDLVRRVAQDHNGRLDVDLSGDGSKVVLTLPASSSAPARRSPIRVNW